MADREASNAGREPSSGARPSASSVSELSPAAYAKRLKQAAGVIGPAIRDAGAELIAGERTGYRGRGWRRDYRRHLRKVDEQCTALMDLDPRGSTAERAAIAAAAERMQGSAQSLIGMIEREHSPDELEPIGSELVAAREDLQLAIAALLGLPEGWSPERRFP